MSQPPPGLGYRERRMWKCREAVRNAILTLQAQGQPLTRTLVAKYAGVRRETADKHAADLGIALIGRVERLPNLTVEIKPKSKPRSELQKFKSVLRRLGL